MAAVAGSRAGPSRAARGTLIAAASSLQFALPEILRLFERETGGSVRVTFGSSGNLMRQILQGAPFELFLSADEAYTQPLVERALTRGRSTPFAQGRLALFAGNASALKVDAELAGLADALGSGSLRRFAIANPQHAPYGKRAEEVLRGRNLWEAIKPRLVLGENVSQAAQFAATSGADGGLIAHSIALTPSFASRGRHALIPAGAHAPLLQHMVLLNRGGETARALFGFMRSEKARTILVRYGFTTPPG